MLRLLDTFSGIGGFSYAAERLVGGFQTVGFVERDPFCQQILRKHWPEVPIHDDITTFKPKRGSADVICGGFPCQDISLAGKQAGIKQGTRSGLFYELMRVIRLVGPEYVVLENVSAILNNGLDTVLGELSEAGFDAEWACIPASAVGACHQRERWWLVAYSNGGNGESRPFSGSSIHEQTAKQGANGDAGSTNEINAAYANSSIGGVRRQQLQWGPTTGESGELHENGVGCAGGLSRASQETSNVANPIESRLEGSRQRWTTSHSLNPNWHSYISKSVLCRGDDGLSGRVDRLKALGNAVVPQVAAIPLQRVLDLAASVA